MSCEHKNKTPYKTWVHICGDCGHLSVEKPDEESNRLEEPVVPKIADIKKRSKLVADNILYHFAQTNGQVELKEMPFLNELLKDIKKLTTAISNL